MCAADRKDAKTEIPTAPATSRQPLPFDSAALSLVSYRTVSQSPSPWDTSVVTRAFAFWIRACPTCRSPHHHQSFRASDAEVRRPARRRQRRKPGSCPPAEEGGEPHVNAGALSWALEPSRLCLWLPETKLKQSEIRLPSKEHATMYRDRNMNIARILSISFVTEM